MRIAGINSPDYQNKTFRHPSSDSTATNTPNKTGNTSPAEQHSSLPVAVSAQHQRNAGQRNHTGSQQNLNKRSSSQPGANLGANKDSVDPGADFSSSTNLPSITHAQPGSAQPNGGLGLMQSSKKGSISVARPRQASTSRVQYFAQSGAVWNAYNTNGSSSASGQTEGIKPDTTSHKARTAISEYLENQFIEERLQYAEVLGIDDYA
jgi:hypothetical protein